LLFLEYEQVLKRPEHRLAHGLTPEAVDEFLAELAALIEPVELQFQLRPQGLDPMTKWCSKRPSWASRCSGHVVQRGRFFPGSPSALEFAEMHPSGLLKKLGGTHRLFHRLGVLGMGHFCRVVFDQFPIAPKLYHSRNLRFEATLPENHCPSFAQIRNDLGAQFPSH
jgi:hypothetical protein